MPAVIGDVFGLGDVYVRQVSPFTVGIDTSGNFITVSGWSDLRSHGWFGGGFPGPGVLSTVDRIDFSNDSSTASIRGPLSSTRYNGAATGNSNYGWFGGGGGSVSTVDRINFSNDSSTASVRGSLSLARARTSATGNSNYGWFGGGYSIPSSPTFVARVDRIDFSNDSSTASIRGSLLTGRERLAATGNSNYGWFGGGNTPAGIVSTVERIDFSNDSSTASLRGNLNFTQYSPGASSNSNYGWFGGGQGPVAYSKVDRVDFTNDLTTTLIRGPLNSSTQLLSGTGNSNYGWFGGGTPGPVSRVDRIDFSNDSATASVRGSLSLARYAPGATSGQARSSSVRLQKAGNYGWYNYGSSDLSIISRINFSNDSATSSPRGSLSSSRSLAAATGNSNYGWFGGGFIPSPFVVTTIVDRIDFSNDSATASVRGPLILARNNLAATGNSNYGWFGGGYSLPPMYYSRVDRIDFSNDSATASIRGPLSRLAKFLAATGNSNYGWFGGGDSPIIFPSRTERVDRIDFSNDNTTASVRGPLSLARYELAATGNSNYGWFGGGYIPGPSVSRVDRIDFSNDSATASIRGPLTGGKRLLAATGNSNYGWFGGGYNPALAPAMFRTLSTVDRIDFSNDSTTASPRGPLDRASTTQSATSNTSFS